MKIQRQFLGSPISQLQSPWLTKATCILGKYQKSKQNKLKTDLVSSSTNKTKLLIENSINQRSAWKALLTALVTRLLYQSYSISNVSSLFDLRTTMRDCTRYSPMRNQTLDNWRRMSCTSPICHKYSFIRTFGLFPMIL